MRATTPPLTPDLPRPIPPRVSPAHLHACSLLVQDAYRLLWARHLPLCRSSRPPPAASALVHARPPRHNNNAAAKLRTRPRQMLFGRTWRYMSRSSAPMRTPSDYVFGRRSVAKVSPCDATGVPTTGDCAWCLNKQRAGRALSAEASPLNCPPALSQGGRARSCSAKMGDVVRGARERSRQIVSRLPSTRLLSHGANTLRTTGWKVFKVTTLSCHSTSRHPADHLGVRRDRCARGE